MARLANALRLVPKKPEPEDEWDELVERLGWERNEEADENVYEWKVSGTDTVVRWVFDDVAQVQFFVVEGSDRQRVAEQIEDSIEMLHVDDFEEYLAQFHGTDGLMHGLSAVAAAAPERYDARVFKLLERYLSHDDPLIRASALYAAAITGWTEFVEPARRYLDDPDPDVRQAAEDAVDILTEPE